MTPVKQSFHKTLQTESTKKKILIEFHQVKSFALQKTLLRNENTVTLEKIFSSHVSDEGLLYKVQK